MQRKEAKNEGRNVMQQYTVLTVESTLTRLSTVDCPLSFVFCPLKAEIQLTSPIVGSAPCPMAPIKEEGVSIWRSLNFTITTLKRIQWHPADTHIMLGSMRKIEDDSTP